MDTHARQLVRLAELLDVSAGVLRDLLVVRNFDGQTGDLESVAEQLETLAARVKDVGRSRLPDSQCRSGGIEHKT